MRFPFKTLLPIVTGFSLAVAGCGSMVKQVDYAPVPDVADYEHPAPIKFSGLDLILPPGMNIGTQRSGIFCQVSGSPANRNIFNKQIDEKFIRQAFHDAMEANGHNVVGSLDVAFDEDEEEEKAEYSIKAKVKDAQVDMCTSEGKFLDFWARTPGQYGQLYLAIDWSVYDYLKRTTVYKVRTEGFTERNIPNQEGLTLMFQDAVEMAAHNLAADPAFKDLIFNAVKPPQDWRDGFDGRGEKTDNRPRMYDPDEDVVIAPQPLSRQPFAKTADQGKNVAVTIHKTGQGSGFFITREGHILTNAHVVGDSRRVRIIASKRKTALTAEILRVDRTRDIALLKLEEIPDWLDITTLPIRLDWPNVGEDVYAISTPRNMTKLKNTITKGIISAHRDNFKVSGIRENYLQADVQVSKGSVGAPLLDEYGNIVAVTADLYFAQEDASGTGLNLFIPIQEALDRLDIDYK